VSKKLDRPDADRDQWSCIAIDELTQVTASGDATDGMWMQCAADEVRLENMILIRLSAA
jgi:hypothetical protein